MIINTNLELPQTVSSSIQKILEEAFSIVESCAIFNDPDIKKFYIRFENNKPQAFLTLDNKTFHTITAFLIKYEEINMADTLNFDNESNAFETKDLKGFLNEIRPIVFNQNDDVFFENAIDTLLGLLKRDGTYGLEISFMDESNDNINATIRLKLRNLKKKIKYIISKSDLDYLYNGVLQHSDRRYKQRLIEEQKNNSFQYTVIRAYVLMIAIINDLSFLYNCFAYLKGFGLFEAEEKETDYIYS